MDGRAVSSRSVLGALAVLLSFGLTARAEEAPAAQSVAAPALEAGPPPAAAEPPAETQVAAPPSGPAPTGPAPAPSPRAEPSAVYWGGGVPPEHFVANGQLYDGNVAGLRAYLDDIKASDPRLGSELSPDLERLESRTTMARLALATGLGVGVATTAYGFLGRSDCQSPSVFDPNFDANSRAWGACNDGNVKRQAVSALLGLGAVVAGFAAWVAITPGRGDIFEFLNKHNRLSPRPLQLQLGYDPIRHVGYGGAGMAF